MPEIPGLQDEQLINCLWAEYRLRGVQVRFLPLGADRNTAVYRVVAGDGTAYFLKLRRGIFDELTVELPRFLNDQGIGQIIAPIPSRTGRLWTRLESCILILYPFLEGQTGYGVHLSDRQWQELGVALKSIHTASLPALLAGRIPRETFCPRWREMTRAFLVRAGGPAPTDWVALELSAFLRAKQDEILGLVRRTEQLERRLRTDPTHFVLCHSDIHPGNVLIAANGTLHIVDWDNPVLAPKERDLMFIGGGLWGDDHPPHEEEVLFYRGYGETEIDAEALTYYRYARIIEDIAVFCHRIFLGREKRTDREQSLRYLMSNFVPDGTIEVAYRSDEPIRDV
jgi:spectinomycin phosphotransferase